MFLKFQPFFIIAETPIHPGSGGSVSIVDLPIQRERHTDYPKIEASGIKGCIREVFRSLRDSDPDINLNGSKVKISDGNIFCVFGPESEGEEESYAGAIAFTDARILLFPVKSLKEIFAWITCPHVLERFKKDMEIAGFSLPECFEEIKPYTVASKNLIISDNQIVLEEFTFKVQDENQVEKIAEWLSEKIFPKEKIYDYWREKLKKDLVILDDNEFRDFVKNSTEIITRTKIDETGTVKEGALWTEEYLPQDTIIYSIAMASGLRVKDEEKKDIFKGANNGEKEAELVIDYFKEGIKKVKGIIQIGGNQTIGKGITRINFLEDKDDTKQDNR